MKMVSMARKPETEKETDTCCVGEDSKYPYGLMIELCDESMMAMGMDTMPVGSVVSVMAKAKVVSCREQEMADGEVECSMTLQITDMGVETGKGMAMFNHPSRAKETD